MYFIVYMEDLLIQSGPEKYLDSYCIKYIYKAKGNYLLHISLFLLK